VAAHGRVDRRVTATEPAGHLALRRERRLSPLLRERLAVLRLLLARVLPLLRRLLVRLAVELLRTGVLTRVLAWLALLLTRLRLLLAGLLLAGLRLVGLRLVGLCVLRELLRRRTVAGRLTWVRVLRRLGRGCGHEWFLRLGRDTLNHGTLLTPMVHSAVHQPLICHSAPHAHHRPTDIYRP
jgi:hypothetical protein